MSKGREEAPQYRRFRLWSTVFYLLSLVAAILIAGVMSAVGRNPLYITIMSLGAIGMTLWTILTPRITMKLPALVAVCGILGLLLSLLVTHETGSGDYIWMIWQGFPFAWITHWVLFPSPQIPGYVRTFINTHPDYVHTFINTHPDVVQWNLELGKMVIDLFFWAYLSAIVLIPGQFLVTALKGRRGKHVDEI